MGAEYRQQQSQRATKEFDSTRGTARTGTEGGGGQAGWEDESVGCKCAEGGRETKAAKSNDS